MEKEERVATPRETAPHGSQDVPQKKTYERPQIVYRAPLEAMASTCLDAGAKSPTDGACVTNFS